MIFYHVSWYVISFHHLSSNVQTLHDGRPPPSRPFAWTIRKPSVDRKTPVGSTTWKPSRHGSTWGWHGASLWGESLRHHGFYDLIWGSLIVGRVQIGTSPQKVKGYVVIVYSSTCLLSHFCLSFWALRRSKSKCFGIATGQDSQVWRGMMLRGKSSMIVGYQPNHWRYIPVDGLKTITLCGKTKIMSNGLTMGSWSDATTSLLWRRLIYSGWWWIYVLVTLNKSKMQNTNHLLFGIFWDSSYTQMTLE